MTLTNVSDAVAEIVRNHSRQAEQETRCSEESCREIGEFLQSCGYRPLNRKLFDTLCKFGASVLDGNSRKGLFLRGDVGIGKTFGLQLLAARFGWKFVTAREVEGFYRTQPDYAEWVEYCRAADFFGRGKTLVIDDLGTENEEFVQYGQRANPLAELLEKRYDLSFHRDRVRTVVTSNLTDQQIKERYGFRAFDRMREMFAVVTVKGESLRK